MMMFTPSLASSSYQPKKKHTIWTQCYYNSQLIYYESITIELILQKIKFFGGENLSYEVK